ncbi:MAG: hypothetical protein QOE70_983 [Chthoniobacter sp.]|nr:hypothetical protein [Chthoniobacter sp.]
MSVFGATGNQFAVVVSDLPSAFLPVRNQMASRSLLVERRCEQRDESGGMGRRHHVRGM